MKIKNKILRIILLMLFILVVNKNISNAAISASSKTVNSGDTVSISIASNIPVLSYKVSMTSSGGLTLVNISGGTVAGSTITNASANGMKSLATYTFKAPNVSQDTKYTVSFSASAMDDENFNSVPNSSAKATITVKAPVKPVNPKDPAVDTKPAKDPGKTTTPKPTPKEKKEEEKKSSDAKLKELSIAESAITPEFNAEVKEYKITVPNEITALNITANPNDAKAKVSIEGNADLVVGENKVTIKVIAEDGTTNEYYINVLRQRTNLALATLKLTYVDKEGNTKEIDLNPVFNPTVLEYSFDEISYLIDSLKVEATANLEGANIEVLGNENLQAGENKITIKLTMKSEQVAEGETEAKDEVVEYTINFTKEATPTPMAKVQNWFTGIFGGVTAWYNQNQEKVLGGALCVSLAVIIGLVIYIIASRNKYKDALAKLKIVNEINNTEENKIIDIEEHLGGVEINNVKARGGRHF